MDVRSSRPAGRSLVLAVALAASLVVPGSILGHDGATTPDQAGSPAAVAPTVVTPAVAPAVSTESVARVYLGEELMRLTNLDRKALGRRVLAPDPLLAAFAREKRVACPGKPSLVIAGRARDMAQRSYFSHNVKGCRTSGGAAVGFSQLLRKLGYRGWTLLTENIGWNDFPGATATYRIGCPRGRLTGCHGTTLTADPVAEMERIFMNSALHRAAVLNVRYDRFGCGAWHVNGGAKIYFSCIFSRGSNQTLDRTGPVISGKTGVGTTIAQGGSFTFAATAKDARMPIAEAWATIDGATKDSWAVDLASLTKTFSLPVLASSLTVGAHTLGWHVRDAGGNVRVAAVPFTVSATAAAARDAARPATSGRATR